MKPRLGKLKTVIREAMDLEKWQAWLAEFEHAREVAGFELKSDLPPYEWISSEGAAAAQVDDGIHAMFEAGLTPEQAVDEMMDADGFWDKWVGEEPISDEETEDEGEGY